MYLYKLLIMQKLLKAKAHFGSSFASSDTQHYIYGFRNNIAIIDLEKTLISLRRACNIIELIIRSKGHVLFVNSDPDYNKIVKQTAILSNQSFINHKWIGGFLTNWIHMQNVQEHFAHFARASAARLTNYARSRSEPKVALARSRSEPKVASGSRLRSKATGAGASRGFLSAGANEVSGFAKATSIARSARPLRAFGDASDLLLKQPRFKKMQRCFEGVPANAPSGLRAFRPDCVIIFNANKNPTAIHEASLLQIPIISLVDSNISNQLHSLITYPIPVNTASIELIYLVANCFLKTILSSRR
jgi:ribosomal protein S2